MSPRTVDEALGRQGGPEGIRWVLQSATSRAALQRRLVSMLAAGAEVRTLRIRSATVNPAHRLRATFDVVAPGISGKGGLTRPILAVWLVKGAEVPAPPLEDHPATPERTWAPFRRLIAADDEWRLRIWAWPFDPSFQTLARLADPEFAGQVMAGVWSGRWAARWGTAGGYVVQPLRYVPRTAHVLRYDPPGARGAGRHSLAVKLSANPGLSALRGAVISAAATEISAAAAPAKIVTSVGDAEGALLYPWVQAGSLAHALARGAPVTHQLRCLGAAVAALQRVPADERLPAATLEGEIKRATHAARHLARLAPAAAEEFAAALEAARLVNDRHPPEAPVLAHGDLKAEHVLLERPAGVTLIDMDSCARAEPALDLGRLMGDLRWASVASGDPGAQSVHGPVLEGYRRIAALPPERLRRARAYEVVAFVRAALVSVKLWHPRWRTHTEAAVAQALALARELR